MVSFFVGGQLTATPAQAAEFWFGATSADITPDRAVPLTGNSSVRIASEVRSRLQANVLVLESREGEETLDQAIWVACDLCVIRPGIEDGFREFMAGKLPGFDLKKLFLAATHTHAAPVLIQDRYDESEYGDAMRPEEYVPFLYEQMAEAVVEAWKNRQQGGVAWGLGYAVAGHNRRMVYSDGTAKMYGNPGTADFRRPEGYEDHGVQILCFYDQQENLKATAMTLATTAQAQGGGQVSADFWDSTRRFIKEQHGEEVCVVGFCSPAGDQTPRPHLRRKSEERMNQLRGLTAEEEVGRRIAQMFNDVAEVIRRDIRFDIPFVHRVHDLDLPVRRVTKEEYEVAQRVCEEVDAKEELERSDYWKRNRYQEIVQRYETQQSGEGLFHPMELHVMRLGDVAVTTSPFELFLDYGLQIEARSPALQTFQIQLTGARDQHAYYLPTPRALAGGKLDENPFTNYSATIMSTPVGPKGGRVLVDETVAELSKLWQK